MDKTDSMLREGTVRTLIIRTAGINCDRELAHAFRLAGSAVEMMHLTTLLDDPALIEPFHLIGIPGGFAYGDDIAAGKIMALYMENGLYRALVQAIERGVCIFAPCNGFQTLTKMGLLPGPLETGEPWPEDHPPRQTLTLMDNLNGRFIDRWLRMEFIPGNPCIWTRGFAELREEELILPIAHGEGRFMTHDQDTLDRIEALHLVVLRYAQKDNINGSANRIAGICDGTGQVFGLMPHPERFTSWQQHPHWTRLDRAMMESTIPLGLRMFRNAVEHVNNLHQHATVGSH